jgi:transketolase
VRKAFVRSLVDLAEADPGIVLLTGDLGFMALEPFSERFPDRFFNVGVAEQNMIGLATGLADGGFRPYCYSIAPFAALRGYEFLRNGPVAHGLPVRVVGVGGGFEYGSAGPTHHGVDDVGVMRVQPGLCVVSPADAAQTSTALVATSDLPGPVYLRIGKDDSREVAGLDGRFELGRTQQVRSGEDGVVFTMGSVSADVVRAVDVLAARGVSPAVEVVASVSPAPVDDIVAALERAGGAAVTVEAHSLVGGLGSLVAETAAEHGIHCRLTRCGADDWYRTPSGSEQYLHGVHGLTTEALVATIEAAVSRAPVERT